MRIRQTFRRAHRYAIRAEDGPRGRPHEMLLVQHCAAQTVRFVENIHRARHFEQPKTCVQHHRNMHEPSPARRSAAAGNRLTPIHKPRVDGGTEGADVVSLVGVQGYVDSTVQALLTEEVTSEILDEK